MNLRPHTQGLPDGPDKWDHFGYNTSEVVLHIQHGKTDKHGNFTPLELVMPRGNLAKLLLAHIMEGQARLIPPPEGSKPTTMFVSGSGRPFNDSTFSQWWASLLKRTAPGITRFPPSLARTSFVEDYTCKYGEVPEMWDGAAAIMGNSVRTWMQNYSPTLRRRRAQDVIAMHEDYTRRRLNTLPDAPEESPED